MAASCGQDKGTCIMERDLHSVSVVLIPEVFNHKARAFHLPTPGCPSSNTSFASLRPACFTCIPPHSQPMNCFEVNLNILSLPLLTRRWVYLKMRICACCVSVWHLCPLCVETRGNLQLYFLRYHIQLKKKCFRFVEVKIKNSQTTLTQGPLISHRVKVHLSKRGSQNWWLERWLSS